MYGSIIESLFDGLGPPDEHGPAALYFTPSARALFQAYRAELEPQLAIDGDLGHMAGWASKLPGAIARIAGLLHVAAHAGRRPPEWIDEPVVASAIELGRYFLAHAVAAFDVMGADQSIADARQVAGWMQREGFDRFTAAAARVALRPRLRTAARVERALEVLTDHGWIRPLNVTRGTDRNGQHRGRTTTEFEVNFLSKKTRKTVKTSPDRSSGLSGSSGERSGFHRGAE
jgi:hypothetical protein